MLICSITPCTSPFVVTSLLFGTLSYMSKNFIFILRLTMKLRSYSMSCSVNNFCFQHVENLLQCQYISSGKSSIHRVRKPSNLLCKHLTPHLRDRSECLLEQLPGFSPVLIHRCFLESNAFSKVLTSLRFLTFVTITVRC